MKKFNLLIITAVITAFCIFAGGCGNSEVNIVRNGTLGNFRNLTIGEAMGNYKYFKDTKWRFLKTANGKRVVEFKASYDVNQNIFKNTDYQKFYLLMQFTLNVNNSFELTYFGTEDICKNGKIKNRNISVGNISECIEKIYANKDTLDLIAPRVISGKMFKWNGKDIVKILDDYKYLKSGEWEVTDYNRIEFHGIIKADKDSRAIGVRKESIEFGSNRLIIKRASSNYDDEAVFHIDIYCGRTNEVISQIAANKRISYIFDPIRLFKETHYYSDLMKYKYLSNKQVRIGKNAKTVIFSGVMKLIPILQQAGIVERKIIIEYNIESNMNIIRTKCFFENKYENGSKKRFDISWAYNVSYRAYNKEDDPNFYHLICQNKDISYELKPLRLFEYTRPHELFNKPYRFIGTKCGKSFFGFIDYKSITYNDYYSEKYYLYFIELISIMSLDVNGRNPKFEKVVMRCHNGKIIDCATDFEKETKIPNPFYYINNQKQFPREWFGENYMMLKDDVIYSPYKFTTKLEEDCKKKNQNLEVFKTIFPLGTINTVSKLKED